MSGSVVITRGIDWPDFKCFPLRFLASSPCERDAGSIQNKLIEEERSMEQASAAGCLDSVKQRAGGALGEATCLKEAVCGTNQDPSSVKIDIGAILCGHLSVSSSDQRSGAVSVLKSVSSPHKYARRIFDDL